MKILSTLQRLLETPDDICRLLLVISKQLTLLSDQQSELRGQLNTYARTRVCVTRVIVGNTVLAENEHSRSSNVQAGPAVVVTIDYRLVDGTTETERVSPQRPVRVHYDGRVWFEVLR